MSFDNILAAKALQQIREWRQHVTLNAEQLAPYVAAVENAASEMAESSFFKQMFGNVVVRKSCDAGGTVTLQVADARVGPQLTPAKISDDAPLYLINICLNSTVTPGLVEIDIVFFRNDLTEHPNYDDECEYREDWWQELSRTALLETSPENAARLIQDTTADFILTNPNYDSKQLLEEPPELLAKPLR
jgi:hypothetical protein